MLSVSAATLGVRRALNLLLPFSSPSSPLPLPLMACLILILILIYIHLVDFFLLFSDLELGRSMVMSILARSYFSIIFSSLEGG